MRYLKCIAVLGLAVSLAACGDDYLTGPELTENPNQPSTVDVPQRYQGIQLTQFAFHTGDLARTAAMWMQQMAGTGRQYINRDLYSVTEGSFNFYFTSIYTGGGLIDLRKLQTAAEADGDRVYAGIGKIWEAYLMGMAASLWGDLMYSEAVGEIEEPKLDEQADVYAAVQSLLDGAIADLESGQGDGPGPVDLVYGGDASLWLEAAHTLKARFYMHWVESQQTGSGDAATACNGDCVEQALAAAQNGISSPDHDAHTYHTSKAGEQNLWYQFMRVFRPGYTSAGKHLVDLLAARDDPRLTEYFAPTPSGEVVGAPPGTSISASQLSADRGAADYDQPLITYVENELILAEAYQRQNDDAEATAHLNNARAVAGLPAISPAAADLLEAIMTEKYIALFQNMEVWNDYKRTCIPALTPATGNAVPGRLLYGSAERNVNSNIPSPSEQPARNDNDPNACT